MQRQPTWREIFSPNAETEPKKIYCIAFTPRSGSTWLAHLVENSQALGVPREWFNPHAASHTIDHCGAGNFPEYYQHIKRFHTVNNAFGFEVAYPHFDKLLQEGYGYVLEEVNAWIFLRRKDFVAQAVSLYRALHSGVYHIRGDSAAPEVPLEYDRDRIAKLAFNLMNREWRFLQYFERKSIDPSMLWYEDLLSMKAEDILALLASIVGVDISNTNEALASAGETDFRITSDDSSKTMIERFKQENSELMNFWNEFRGTCPADRFVDEHPSYADVLTLTIT